MWNPFRKTKIKRYKRKSVRSSRTKYDQNYKINFSFLILDPSENLEIENIEVDIPARSMYDAKNKLKTFLERKISFHINDVEVSNFDDSEDFE